MGSEFLGSYVGFVVPLFPTYKDRATLSVKWLDETLPKYLQKLQDLKKKSSAYLVSDSMTIADLVMFSHFWKLAYNPKAESDLADGIKAAIAKHRALQDWCEQMRKDLDAAGATGKLMECAF